MPLNAANFIQNGHLIHQDLQQFVDLLTGVMTDQPVTVGNTLRVTGVATMASDIVVGGAVKFGTSGASTTTIYSPNAGSINVTAITTLGGGLFFSPDNAYDVGATATGRPRNLYVASTITTGTLTAAIVTATNYMQSPIYNVGTNSAVLQTRGTGGTASLESPLQYVMVVSKSGTHIAANAYWDGANWQRWDTTVASSLLVVTQNNIVFDGAGAATGVVAWGGVLTISNTATGRITFNSGGYIQDYGSGYVQISQLTVTPGSTSLANLTVNGNTQINGQLNVTGSLVLNRGQYIQWTDANTTHWINTDYNNYFDTYNAGWYFRNSAAGMATEFSIGSGGVVSAAGQVNAPGFNATGNYYYFASGAAYWQWDGSWIRSAGGSGIGTSGSYVWMAGNAQVGMYYDGTYNHIGPNVMSRGAVYLSDNGGIYMTWQGSVIQFSHGLISGGAFYFSGNTGIYLNWDGTWIGTSHPFNARGNCAVNGQTATASSFDNGAHGNGFLAPNNNPGGVGLGQSWGTYGCVDHAVEYGLRMEPIADALCFVQHIQGWSYDHVQHAGTPTMPLLRNEDGDLITRPLYGFKPSEVARYLPELVGYNPETGEPESIDLDRMCVVLWEAFKQHAAQTDARLSQLERTHV